MNIDASVDRIFDYLQQLGSVIPSRRRVGLSPEVIQEVMGGLGLKPSVDLTTLYAYCDGTSTLEGEKLEEIQFIPGFYWMSLNEALATYRSVSRSAEWQASWLPIFANGGGDFYAVICDQSSSYFGEVVGFVLGETDQVVEFSNVASLFGTVERSFTEGAFFVANGMLKADYPRMRAIAREVQPGFVEHEV